MFNKFTSKPMNLPMVDAEEEVEAGSRKLQTDTHSTTEEPFLKDEGLFYDVGTEPDALSEKKAFHKVEIHDFTYDNTNQTPKVKTDLLSSSLHTTESQDSIEFPAFSKENSKADKPPSKRQDPKGMSLHVSSLDMSDLKDMEFSNIQEPVPESKDITAEDEPNSARVTANHNITEENKSMNNAGSVEAEEIALNSGVSLKAKEETQTPVYRLERHRRVSKLLKMRAALVVLIVLIAGIKYATKTVESDSQSSYTGESKGPTKMESTNATLLLDVTEVGSSDTMSTGPAVKGKALNIKVDNQGFSVFIGDKEYKEELINDECGETFAVMKNSVLAMLAILAMSKLKKTKSVIADNQDDEATSGFLPAIKKEASPVREYDLSAYESLKYIELRELLRKRNCKGVGKKHVLVKRLATVYKAELDTLTVIQLRKLLKAHGFTQAGRKHEIIRTLVEDGL